MTGSVFDEEFGGGAGAESGTDDKRAACGAEDLKSLLNTIVDQIAEADRRHSDTLQQLQDRLAGLGREAKAIKPRIPDQYAAAFGRIETGMAELASRIADAAEQHDVVHDARQARDAYSEMVASEPAFDDKAQSADSPPVFGTTHAYDDVTSPFRSTGRPRSVQNFAGVDPFDIIDSTSHGNSDPWDRDAAEALTGVFDTDATGFATDPYATEFTAPPSEPEPHFPNAAVQHIEPEFAAKPASSVTPPSPAAAHNIDKEWLEDRFAEIAKRIEESLGEIRPDQGFFALNQRVDQFEQNLTAAIENIANRGDVDGVHLIESRVNDLASELESAQNQLRRLDEIENQLASIAAKLEDVHYAATTAMDSDGTAPVAAAAGIDYDTVARTAAEAAAAEFSRARPASDASVDTAELGSMLREFIAESRQGDENTAALLDTLQQAMIGLLDRVESMEFPAMEPHQQFAAVESYTSMSPREEELEEAVAAVASTQAASRGASRSQFDQDERSPERLRQDFIAEARRAKMRLAAEAEAAADAGMSGSELPSEREYLAGDAAPEFVENEPAPNSIAALRGKKRETNVAPDPEEVKKAAKAAAKAAKKTASSSSSSRIRVLGLAVLLALGGAYATLQSGLLSGGDTATPVVDQAATAPASGEAPPASATAPAPVGGATDLKLPADTRGDITPGDITVGATSVPLFGVAVDTERPVTADVLERARRQQAMAAVSGELGQAAAVNSAAVAAMPAALESDDAASADAAPRPPISSSAMTRSAPLDLPPATVGPLSLRLAAANGDPSAQFEVGARLAEGSGTAQTFEEAAKWYQRAAAKGLPQAQYRLGTLYERGLGVKQDKARAEDWYRRAARQGNVKAMHNLAVLRANATTGSPDYMTAAQWFERAAEHGLADSQFNLAVLDENGLGVPQDMVSAYKWLSLAAKTGDKEAIRRRDVLKGKLSKVQLADAEKRIASFRAKRPDPDVNDAFRAGEAWKKNSANGISG